MTNDIESKALHDAVVSCKVPDIIKAVDEALKAGMDPKSIIDYMGTGMTEVGVLFERGKLFLPHVLSAAAGMTKAVETLQPLMKDDENASDIKKPIAVMGTVEGDVHDIGKSICSTMLQCAGFEVNDLGRDVPLGKFTEGCKNGARFCGMSALMTTTMVSMPVVIKDLEDQGLRGDVVVMVGGAPITQAYASKIGADIYGESASETTEKAKSFLKG